MGHVDSMGSMESNVVPSKTQSHSRCRDAASLAPFCLCFFPLFGTNLALSPCFVVPSRVPRRLPGPRAPQGHGRSKPRARSFLHGPCGGHGVHGVQRRAIQNAVALPLPRCGLARAVLSLFFFLCSGQIWLYPRVSWFRLECLDGSQVREPQGHGRSKPRARSFLHGPCGVHGLHGVHGVHGVQRRAIQNAVALPLPRCGLARAVLSLLFFLCSGQIWLYPRVSWFRLEGLDGPQEPARSPGRHPLARRHGRRPARESVSFGSSA